MKIKNLIILIIITFLVIIYFLNYGQSAPDFNKITDSNARKKQFFTYLSPIIKQQNQKILVLRNKIKNNQLSDISLKKIAKKYRINVNNLLNAVDIIPTSLVLAQAANESNWGRSRFVKYYNYYGIWCFTKGCGIVPYKRDINARHEVAIFSTIESATSYYLLNLNSHPAYQKMRDIRMKERLQHNKLSGLKLAEGLEKYSGIGLNYIKDLQQIIKYNKLWQYD